MAIAPSKLGRVVAQEWYTDEALILRLRGEGLVREDATDVDLRLTLARARKEDAALPSGEREYTSLNERVRVFLGPFLTEKGREWAVPLTSLELSDDDA